MKFHRWRGSAFFALGESSAGKIPQDDGDWYEVSFLLRPTCETSQPHLPRL